MLTCPNCETTFSPKKGYPNQRFCQKRCRINYLSREWSRTKYNTDSTYRKSFSERHKKWRDNNHERLREVQIRSWKKSATLYPWLHSLEAAKQRAKKTGMPFDLTREWAIRTWTGRCAITNLPFVIGKVGKRIRSAYSPSLDRIDSKKGYTQDNSRFILWSINAFRGPWDDETMYKIAEAIIANRS